MRLSAGIASIVALVAGCSEDSGTPPSGAEDRDGGADDAGTGCAPGEQPLDAGGCRAAGIPPDACGVGFEANATAGCDAVLPADPCGPGLIALPGETSCHEIMPCGDGRWADDLPDESGTQFVDASFVGTSDGTAAMPWKTLQEAIDAAAPGSLVAVGPGTYGETAVSAKAVRIWGKCPAEVALVGVQPTGAAIQLLSGSAGSLVRGLALTGPGAGAFVSGAATVTLERVWVHDTESYGVCASDMEGATDVVFSTALIESARVAGLLIEGASAAVSDAGVRTTRTLASTDTLGEGVIVLRGRDSGGAASATLTHCVIEQNHSTGVIAAGADVELSSTVIRDTLEQPTSKTEGDGIEISDDDKWHKPSNGKIVGSVIERNHDTGVFVRGSEATIDATVVRDTQPRVSDGLFGRGIELVPGAAGRAHATIRSSVVERNHSAAVMVSSSDVVVESALVRETQPNATNQAEGFGIYLQKGSGERANGRIRWCTLESNRDVALMVAGSDAEIVGVVVVGTLARASDGAFGRGIQVQLDVDDSDPGRATISSSLIADNLEGGVMAFGSEVGVEGSWIRGTRPSKHEFGDGLVVAGLHGSKVQGEGILHVEGSRIEDNARAGIASFSGTVTLKGNDLECNAIPLDGEDFLGTPFAFEDLGENTCACDGTATACKVLSSNLAPPDPLPTP